MQKIKATNIWGWMEYITKSKNVGYRSYVQEWGALRSSQKV
jgi:hypothetical protein